MSKIRVVAGDLPVTLSPSDSMVKKSDILDTAPASSDECNTLSLVVHAISIQSGCKAISRLINKICSQVKVIARNLSRRIALCTHGAILAASA